MDEINNEYNIEVRVIVFSFRKYMAKYFLLLKIQIIKIAARYF